MRKCLKILIVDSSGNLARIIQIIQRNVIMKKKRITRNRNTNGRPFLRKNKFHILCQAATVSYSYFISKFLFIKEKFLIIFSHFQSMVHIFLFILVQN